MEKRWLMQWDNEFAKCTYYKSLKFNENFEWFRELFVWLSDFLKISFYSGKSRDREKLKAMSLISSETQANIIFNPFRCYRKEICTKLCRVVQFFIHINLQLYSVNGSIHQFVISSEPIFLLIMMNILFKNIVLEEAWKLLSSQ